MSLYDCFIQHNPISTDVEQRAVKAFERLLRNSDWKPDNPYWGGFLPVVEVGILAEVLEGTDNAKGLLRLAVEGVVTGKTASSMLAELHVGALLRKLKCSVRFVQQASVRTPDLIVMRDGQPVDVEVGRSEKRRVHLAHRQILENLAHAINIPDDRNYAIFVAVELTDEMGLTILDAIVSTPIDGRRDEVGKWSVVVGALSDREEYVRGLASLAPPWWPNGPAFCSTSTRLGRSLAPVTSIKTIVPVASYIGRVKAKAEKPQRTGDYPYVVALDASELPGAHARLLCEVMPWLQQWSHVSAILIEFPVFAIGEQKWWCSLLRNKHAKRPIPNGLFDGLDERVSKIPV